ncbi:hypothetical protein AAHC03_013125 [Spirometra sp. Aus1]
MNIESKGKKFSVISFGGRKNTELGLSPDEVKTEELPVSNAIDDVVVPVDDDVEEDPEEGKLGLYEEEYSTRPPSSTFIQKLASYTGGIEPTTDETKQLRQKQATIKPVSQNLLEIFFGNDCFHCCYTVCHSRLVLFTSYIRNLVSMSTVSSHNSGVPVVYQLLLFCDSAGNHVYVL